MNNWQKNAILIFLSLIIVLTFGTVAQAEEPLEARKVQVDLKPEYDSSDVLTMYNVYLKNVSSQPYKGTVKILVPKDASIGSTCEITDAGQHNCQLYDTKVKGDKKLVTWETKTIQPGEEYHGYLEYYFNPLQISGDKRNFDFNYTATYPTQNLILKVTEPSQTSNFTANLEEIRVQTGQKGLKNHFYKLEEIKMDQSIDLKINYQRAISGPSFTKDSGQSTGSTTTQQTNQQATQEKAGSGTSPVMIVLVAIILGVMAYFIYYTATDGDSTAKNQKSNKQSSARKTNESKRDSEDDNLTPAEEKKQARQLLLEGKISEKTYRDIVEEIEEE